MFHDVVAANYRGDYLIEVEFDDGKRGVVDFVKYLERGGVFERFKDIDFFRHFSVNEELGILTWDNEIEVAPETLYALATGYELPAWMEAEEKSAANRSNKSTATGRPNV